MKEWMIATAISVMAVFAPIKPVLIVVGVLIFADTITGMIAAKRRGEEITSAGARRMLTKSFVYLSVVMLGFLLETYLLEALLPVAKIVAGAIGMVEFKSILENSNSITGTDIFKTVIKKLGSENDKAE